MANNNLRRAERKVRRLNKREWCGYLTPSEMLALVQDGARPTPNNQTMYDYHLERRERGESSPSWFYFYPSKEQLQRLISHPNRER